MSGYIVFYLDESGINTFTFFGEPDSSLDLDFNDKLDAVLCIFSLAHPKCKVTSIAVSDLDQFNEMIGK